MITKIEARNFRSLKNISQKIGHFHALVGANGSGKSTFMDILAFISDFIKVDWSYALRQRGITDVKDLFWKRRGNFFSLAIEFEISDKHAKSEYINFRYADAATPELLSEKNMASDKPLVAQYALRVEFDRASKKTTLKEVYRWGFLRGSQHAVGLNKKMKAPGQELNEQWHKAAFASFMSVSESWDSPKWPISLRSNFQRRPLIADEDLTPSTEFDKQVASNRALLGKWFANYLIACILPINPQSEVLRKASPPIAQKGFTPDGSGMAWQIDEMKQKSTERFKQWLDHLRTAVPDIEDILTFKRPEDKHCWLAIKYAGGLKVPSWLVSDGTLKLMALTLPAYLSETIDRCFLIEEPENGLHPTAIKTVIDSLRSIYGGQAMVATHSPIVLSELKPEEILCFSKNDDGSARIISGDEHPLLQKWKGKPGLDDLFASGVLG